jgi:glucose-6-phosphate 1-dehydrogenase
MDLLTTDFRAIELKKDVAIVVLGASGDLAKKKTV